MSGKLVIVDYGVGNLRSVQKAFSAGGHDAIVSGDPGEISGATHLVLPGVGAFGAAASTLRAANLESVVLDFAASGKPFLGICVGMQLLFDRSEELGEHRGLGLVPGDVLRFDERNLGDAARGAKVPQIGWNALSFPKASPLFENIPGGAMVYFVHSYFCRPNEPSAVASTTPFLVDYCSSVSVGNVHGVQFHPEKSGAIGLRLLKNFASL